MGLVCRFTGMLSGHSFRQHYRTRNPYAATADSSVSAKMQSALIRFWFLISFVQQATKQHFFKGYPTGKNIQQHGWECLCWLFA